MAKTDLSSLLDWRFDEPPSQLPDLPTPDELNMIFPPHFPVFGSFTPQLPRSGLVFPEFDSEDYGVLVEVFGADKQPFPFALYPELAAELWELTQNMGESLFEKSEFIPEVQENRFVESGFEEFAGFGIDFDEPAPSEDSSDYGHSS